MRDVYDTFTTSRESGRENKERLEKLNEVSFMLNDLAVYLDSHPSDERAAGWFDAYNAERKELLEVFEERMRG